MESSTNNDEKKIFKKQLNLQRKWNGKFQNNSVCVGRCFFKRNSQTGNGSGRSHKEKCEDLFFFSFFLTNPQQHAEMFVKVYQKNV